MTGAFFIFEDGDFKKGQSESIFDASGLENKSNGVIFCF
jgi:hypothetical protein